MKYLSNINLNLNEIQKVVIQNLNTVPITSSDGQIYYDTSISKLKLKTAAGWVIITSGGSGGPETLDQVLTNGNISQIDAFVGGIFLYNPNIPSGNGYVSITGDKNRFNFYNNANVYYANIAQDSLVLIDSVVPTRQFQIKKPAAIGANRVATFQDASGTVAYLSDIPTGTISGSGTINFLPKFTSLSSVGDSPHSTTSQVLIVNDSGRTFINLGTVRLSVQRAQSQIDFNCGNPGFNEPSSIISDNQIDGFEILSKGELALKTGVTYANEGIKIFSTGKLKFTQTPDVGATSDFILLRDTSGNVKQIAGNTYVTTANSTLQNAYNNSTDGKILLDLTRGAVKVQAITGTIRTIESYNVGATTPNFYVDPSGNPFGNYFYAAWFNTAFGSGLQDNSGTVRLNSAYDGIAGQGRWESNQRINYLADYSALYSNRSLIDKGYADTTYVPISRTLTINGTSYDLSADRTWSVGTVTNVSANMTNPSQSVAVTNPTTIPNITIDDTNLLYNKFMVNQYSYLFPSDGNVLWDNLRVGGTLLTTGTNTSLSETPMGQLFATVSAAGSVTGFFGTNFGSSFFGVNFEMDFSYRFRINTNNGAQRFFAGLSNMYGTATPTNIEPTNMINSVGVAKLQGSANLFFIWNDATGTASSLDLGSGFLGTDTSSTYRIRIWKKSGIASLNIELYKTTSGGTLTVTSLNITSDYNTGVNHNAAIWMGNNTGGAGIVSFKNYGCQILKRNLVST